MKLDCEVIRDLLPLYAEDMASPASTALVEEHLQECEACRAELEQMQLPVPVQPEPQPDAPLKGIRTALRKKRILTAAAAVLAVLCAVVLVFWMGNLSTPVTAEEAGIWLYNKKEDGANLCVLEVQGENVRLETEGGFSWGKEYITVRAMRYTFPGLHAALTKLTGSEIVSRDRRLPHPGAGRGVRGRNALLQRQPAGGTIHCGGESGRHRAVRVRHRGTIWARL